MSNTKRWTVTYTKHMTQKRKVYQDGILELRGSNNKVMLYDDGEKLIDGRFLKKDETVNLGGTLTLGAHLVEIGILEGENDMPLRNSHDGAALNSTNKGRKLLHKGNLHMLHKQLPNKESKSMDFGRRVPISSDNKGDIQKIIQKQDNLNVMQGKIKDDYMQILSCLELNDSCSLIEWDVLYTTQLTQKSKKYHDGILKLSVCSSHMNQIVLLSEDGTMLSSKFLKYAECVKTGNKCDFPAYLVEICEARSSTQEEIQKAPTKLSTFSCSDNRNLQNPRDREKVHVQKILSHKRKASDEPMINNKHQQTDKPVRNEEIQKAPTKLSTFSCSDNRNLHNPCGNLGDREKVHAQKILSHNRKASDDPMSCKQQQTDKPVRNACQIMFTLKKPVLEEQNHQYELTKDSANPSPSADFASLNAKDQISAALNSLTTRYANEIVVDNEKDSPAKGPNLSFVQGARDFKSKDSEYVSSSDITTSKDIYSTELPIYQDCSSNNPLSGSTPKLEVDFLNEESLTNKTSREEHRCLYPGSSSSNSKGNYVASGKEDVAEHANSSFSVSNDPDIADKTIGMASPGTSEVDELSYQIIYQTRTDNIKVEDGGGPFQLLDEPMVTDNIYTCSELQSSSGTCIDISDDIPTFDLGF